MLNSSPCGPVSSYVLLLFYSCQKCEKKVLQAGKCGTAECIVCRTCRKSGTTLAVCAEYLESFIQIRDRDGLGESVTLIPLLLAIINGWDSRHRVDSYSLSLSRVMWLSCQKAVITGERMPIGFSNFVEGLNSGHLNTSKSVLLEVKSWQ